MDIDYELLRRYAGYILGEMTLAQAKTVGFVQDANDEDHWNMASNNPEQYVQDSPDSEIPPLLIHDMTVIDDMLTRVKEMK